VGWELDYGGRGQLEGVPKKTRLQSRVGCSEPDKKLRRDLEGRGGPPHEGKFPLPAKAAQDAAESCENGDADVEKE